MVFYDVRYALPLDLVVIVTRNTSDIRSLLPNYTVYTISRSLYIWSYLVNDTRALAELVKEGRPVRNKCL
jgi:hypothetical protein